MISCTTIVAILWWLPFYYRDSLIGNYDDCHSTIEDSLIGSYDNCHSTIEDSLIGSYDDWLYSTPRHFLIKALNILRFNQKKRALDLLQYPLCCLLQCSYYSYTDYCNSYHHSKHYMIPPSSWIRLARKDFIIFKMFKRQLCLWVHGDASGSFSDILSQPSTIPCVYNILRITSSASILWKYC